MLFVIDKADCDPAPECCAEVAIRKRRGLALGFIHRARTVVFRVE